MKGQDATILFWAAILLNCLAVFIGASLYSGQFALHPQYLAVFVPDCPLYVFLTLIILFGIIRNEIFSFIVSIGMVKYGLWTVFVLLFHPGYYFTSDIFNMSVLLVLGHLGMALEGLAILPKKRLAPVALALAIGWFLINDFSDYFLGTVPIIPPAGMSLVRDVTIASSVLIPFLLFMFAAQIKNFAPIPMLRNILFNDG